MTQNAQDQFEIQDLIYLYGEAVDERDPAKLARCFANGQVNITGPGFEMKEAVAVTGMLSSMYEWTMHAMHNHRYTVEGNKARGYTYCIASHVSNKDGQRSKLDWYVRYEDDLAKVGGRWGIVRRNLVVAYQNVAPVSTLG
ncbi:MAG: nuclear transport factor 2 family protein [Proteobacteria bacterium]|nr:nuclear transport factor 2 family protein [Pseudomonadota bacterium]HQR03563.1 nuclear transport factor 2 family protein [Rhodocyclaceae bacterium]